MQYQAFEQLEVRELFDLALREKAPSALDDLLRHKPTLHDLSVLTLEELQAATGLNAAKALQLKAIMELARRYATLRAPKPESIRSAADVAALLTDMTYLDREVFRTILVDTKHHVIHVDTVAVGGLSSCTVHPREVFKAAIKCSAAAMILAHNHPSGDPEPSLDDIAVTKRFIEVGEVIGINVLDHIVIGSYGYVNLRERSLAFN